MQIVSLIVLLLLIFAIFNCNAQQTFSWSGYQWYVRNQQNSGPGPNNWNANNVWIDSSGFLHLKLSYSSANGWSCAEVYSVKNFQYGTFRWFVEGAVDQLDPYVVLGLFTYKGPDGTNEIDIEFAKWGQTNSGVSNLFYTTYPSASGIAQPVSVGTLISLDGTYTTNQFNWTSTSVASQIQGGFISNSQTKNLIYSYTTPNSFSSAIPSAAAPVHMNLWSFQGQPPINGQEVEIILHDFKYTKN